MLSLHFSTVNRKIRVKFIAIVVAFVLTVLLAVVISACYSHRNTDDSANSQYVFDLEETGGIGGFLSQFGLQYQRQESARELTLPQSDDSIFAEYADFQSELGLSVLKFSGKRVEERYLKLKNKTERGKQLYAVLYIYKERIIAAHLTDLEQGSELLPITAFV